MFLLIVGDNVFAFEAPTWAYWGLRKAPTWAYLGLNDEPV